MVKFTIDDVSKHNTVNDCWIIIYNEVYNITEFMKKDHSGGFIPLSVAGKDATNLFIVTHPLYVKIHYSHPTLYQRVENLSR